MSTKIDREGSFKGWILESGCGINENNGNIQFVAKLQAVEEYDFESQTFVDISAVEEVEITGYFTVFGKDTSHPVFFGKQLKDALGWNGDVRALNTEDYSAIPVQFKVEEEEYNKKKKLKVTRIDHVDAIPGGSVTKVSEDKLDAALARYATAQRELMGGDKPAAIPTARKVTAKKAAAPPAVPKTKTQASENVESAKELAKAAVEEQKERAAAAEFNALSPAEKKAAAKKKTAPKAPPAVPKVAKPAPVTEEPPVEEKAAEEMVAALDLAATCTKDEAWDACESNTHPVKVGFVAEVWAEVVKELGYEDEINKNQDWPEVRTRVLVKVIDDIPF